MVEHAVAVVLLLVALLVENNGGANYELGTNGGSLHFPVLLLYASLTNLETVFKVAQLTPKSQ